MSPFLVHGRETICFGKPKRKLKRGDMVFYQRKNGQFVMHRIWKIKTEGLYLVGDAQQEIEGPIDEAQIFALVNRVKRKGKWIGPGDFWGEFFAKVWIRIVPLRRCVVKAYGVICRK